MVWEVEGFDWDEGNKEKAQKHGLSLDQIERVLQSVSGIYCDENHSSMTENRYIALGQMQGKWVFISYTLRVKDGALYFRVISASYAREKEVLKIYEKNQKAKKVK